MKYFTRCVPLTLVAILFAAGCASTSYIEVVYKLPEAQGELSRKTASLNVIDMRRDKRIAGPDATKELESFTGLFSLYIERDDKKPQLIGAFNLTALFREATRQRLASKGIEVLDKKAVAGTPKVEIQLQEFVLDRDGKNWKATLAYKAALSKDNRVLATQTVSGSAERLKIMGTRDAEKLLGDIFSDMINRLDIEKLFSHPDL